MKGIMCKIMTEEEEKKKNGMAQFGKFSLPETFIFCQQCHYRDHSGCVVPIYCVCFVPGTVGQASSLQQKLLDNRTNINWKTDIADYSKWEYRGHMAQHYCNEIIGCHDFSLYL